MEQPWVIKIGGHEITDLDYLQALGAFLKLLPMPILIVHGGGKEISETQEKFGITPQKIDGVRITDAQSLDIVTMVLCGLVNKRLVSTFLNAGLDAIGLSGADRGIVRAVKMPHESVDMQYSGDITSVDAARLIPLLDAGMTPVIAPICLGTDSLYNVNADHVAGAIAGALGAERAIFLTNVEGVLIDGEVATTISAKQAEAYIADGTIYGGMVPKVRTALQSLERGVSGAVITNLAGLQTHGGTVFA